MPSKRPNRIEFWTPYNFLEEGWSPTLVERKLFRIVYFYSWIVTLWKSFKIFKYFGLSWKALFWFRTEFWNFRSSQTRKELLSRIIVNRESNISQIKSDLSPKKDQKYREVIFRIYTLHLEKGCIYLQKISLIIRINTEFW